MKDIITWTRSIWREELFNIGTASFSVGSIIYLLIAITALFILTGFLRRVLVSKVLTRFHMDIGVRESIGTIVRYVLVVIGLIIIVQSTGIDLSALGILLGALGVGIGFGLQNITNNFISGVIILFERPIKVGDRIELGGMGTATHTVHGMVQKISPRATTILTNDNVAIIVPNSEFISGRVINWSHNDTKVRFRVSVDVAYGSDVPLVKKLLMEVADEDTNVMKRPAANVRLDKFGDNGITFTLLVWTSTLIHRRGLFMSNLNYRIEEKFRQNDIVIPFPQRDLHLKSGIELLPDREKEKED